ncbi:hypothetical protein [Nakamurella sp. PAMC28650]|uniref:hypothetical protein n=1 Tax=Nakamurella sp. PAMC28650 TaxID=2762325 RepID=UPI00164D17B6|nr:hypothetical protein [Nakamurella sp. PAMC28650]QNK80392.1 hypothetical protein H7F38_19685 [Nakamurella sp. PAMC28650]
MLRHLLLGFLCSAVLLTVVALPADASIPAPTGRLELVQTNSFSNTVIITGWALDPSARTVSSSVQVTMDRQPLGTWRSADLPRIDVNTAMHATGGHGFKITLTLPAGQHLVCLDARDVSSPRTTASLGCFSFHAYPPATKADMLAIAKTIDPNNTINWTFTALATGMSGQAQPWNRLIDVASGNSVHYLRAVMLHEWAHVLQYRAYSGTDPWFDAVQAFNELLGDPNDRHSYNGVEHGADCIAQALGADYLGYGCPTALKALATRIAHGARNL